MSDKTGAFKAITWLCCFAVLGLGIGLGMSYTTCAVDPRGKTGESQPLGNNAATEQSTSTEKSAKGEKSTPAGIDIAAAPPDVNDISLEVAALRTIYLLNAWPDHKNDSWKYHTNPLWHNFREFAKDTAEAPKKRTTANVSGNYKRALTQLRAAYITGEDDRIIDLTDQLDELGEDEEPELYDVVEVTEKAKKNAQLLSKKITPECIVSYLNSYGKDFPSPVNMIGKALMDRAPGGKILPETIGFVSKEVGLAIGGFEKEKEVAEKVRKIMEKASTNNWPPEQCKKEWHIKGDLRKEYNKAMTSSVKDFGNPYMALEHLMERDMAELLSNPRLIPAIEARLAYLKKAGYDTTTTKDDAENVDK